MNSPGVMPVDKLGIVKIGITRPAKSARPVRTKIDSATRGYGSEMFIGRTIDRRIKVNRLAPLIFAGFGDHPNVVIRFELAVDGPVGSKYHFFSVGRHHRIEIAVLPGKRSYLRYLPVAILKFRKADYIQIEPQYAFGKIHNLAIRCESSAEFVVPGVDHPFAKKHGLLECVPVRESVNFSVGFFFSALSV